MSSTDPEIENCDACSDTDGPAKEPRQRIAVPGIGKSMPSPHSGGPTPGDYAAMMGGGPGEVEQMMSSVIEAVSSGDMPTREMMLWQLVIRLQLENIAIRNVLCARHVITEHELRQQIALATMQMDQQGKDIMEKAVRSRAQQPVNGQDEQDPRATQ